MLRLGLVVLGVESMARAVSFWTEALNYEVLKGGSAALVVLEDPDGNVFCIVDAAHVQAQEG